MVSSASSTVTDLPVCASRMAAARPLGPEPTTTASTGESAKLDDGALRGRLNRDTAIAMGRDDPIDLVVGAGRAVTNEQQPARPGGLGEANRELDRGTTARVP